MDDLSDIYLQTIRLTVRSCYVSAVGPLFFFYPQKSERSAVIVLGRNIEL